MDALIAFLRAHLDNREGEAEGLPEAEQRRLAADIAAKRRIIDECEKIGRYSGPAPGTVRLADTVLRQLGAAHAEHPDYNADWLP